MTDHYDRVGEIIARMFNYAQLRIDIWEMEMRQNIQQQNREAYLWLWNNDKRVMAYCEDCRRGLIGNSMLGRTLCDECLAKLRISSACNRH